MKGLKATSGMCSFIYYFSDNIVWLSKIGFVKKFVPLTNEKWRWGYIKDNFSLIKTVLELIIYIYTYVLKAKEDV